MKEWNSVSPEHKFLEWRLLREKIKVLPLEEKLDTMSKFFFSVPIGKRCIDFYNPSSWPTPWEILHNCLYCENTVAILMYYTLELIDEGCKKELLIIDNSSDRFLVVLINDCLILNYELGKVNKYSDIKDTVRVVDRISNTDIKFIE